MGPVYSYACFEFQRYAILPGDTVNLRIHNSHAIERGRSWRIRDATAGSQHISQARVSTLTNTLHASALWQAVCGP